MCVWVKQIDWNGTWILLHVRKLQNLSSFICAILIDVHADGMFVNYIIWIIWFPFMLTFANVQKHAVNVVIVQLFDVIFVVTRHFFHSLFPRFCGMHVEHCTFIALWQQIETANVNLQNVQVLYRRVSAVSYMFAPSRREKTFPTKSPTFANRFILRSKRWILKVNVWNKKAGK